MRLKIICLIHIFQYICFVRLHKYILVRVTITVKATNELMVYENNLNQCYFNNIKGLK